MNCSRMSKFKRPIWRSIHSEKPIVAVVGATMITRRIYVFDRLVWQTYWIRFQNNQVVKLGSLADSSTVTKLNKRIKHDLQASVPNQTPRPLGVS
jgi:hypothetical protein